ncbi:sodium/potassium/calcium exchanger 1 [Anabrus simplex]|uniref:sodium/potassium/calcium exchanger 1 n=1 Tax=Anabrus simplex TaxID=316456 RepID=UPI0035A2704B
MVIATRWSLPAQRRRRGSAATGTSAMIIRPAPHVFSISFCPNLEVIAKSLNLSEATAGVTILAFGNGSPDIFTSIAGVPRGHVELIFCEIIGGGIFITTVLVGTICIKYPLNIVRRILMRDVFFYLLSLGWTYYTFSKHYVTIYDTGGYLVLYGVYLLAVISDRRFRQTIVNRASQLIPESDLERLRRLHGGSRDGLGSPRSSRASRSSSSSIVYGGERKDDSESRESIYKKSDEGKPESKESINKKPDEDKRESKGSIHSSHDEKKHGSKGSIHKKRDEKKHGSKGSIHKKRDEKKHGSKGSIHKKRDEKKHGSKGSIHKKTNEEKPTKQQDKKSTNPQRSKNITFDETAKYKEDGRKSQTWRKLFQTCWKSKTEDETTQPMLDVEKNPEISKNLVEEGVRFQESLDVEENTKESTSSFEFLSSCCKCKTEDETTKPSHDVEKKTKKSKTWREFFSTCCQRKSEDETTQPLLGLCVRR